MGNGILITGVPGFIGRRLTQALLPQGRPLYLLCERRFLEETERTARQLDPAGEQVFAVGGDITEDHLGLAEPDRIRAEVDEVYHLAAVYDLAVPEDVARRVNVVGTGKVLKFLRTIPQVRHNYISTCYVSGTRTNMVFEDELDRGQEFKNHYESTKFAAEVLVERSKRDLETRIFRPAIVIGDSKTGETQKFDGPYPTFGAIMMGWMLIVPSPGTGRPNLVPVDFIVDCLTTIPTRPDTAGKTFQLADPEPLSSRELVELVAERLGAPRPRLALPELFFKGLFKLDKLVEASRLTPESLAYYNHYVIYDTTNTRAALRGTPIECPPLRSYLNQILRYYRDHVQLPWRFDTPP
ncbi:MAG: SDR family oxidoreductase [Planctomycetota bacterium]